MKYIVDIPEGWIKEGQDHVMLALINVRGNLELSKYPIKKLYKEGKVMCPKCGSLHSTVKDCRRSKKYINCVKRKKVCKDCETEYITYELDEKNFANLVNARMLWKTRMGLISGKESV